MSLAFLRLFVAIAVPPDVRREIAGVQSELRPLADPEDVRWVKSEQLHLTLKFLGNVPTASLDAVTNSLTEAGAGVQPFPLRAKGIGFFPNSRRPRVIWVGFESDEPALTNLQTRVARQLAPFVEKPGEENFLAHATLGRFQKYRRRKTENLVPRALSFAGKSFGAWEVKEIVLFRSDLSPDGARHTPLAVFPLDANLKA